MTSARTRRMRRRAGSVARVLGVGVLTTALLGGLFVLGLGGTKAELSEVSAPTGAAPAGGPYGSGKLTVAVVLGATGTIGTDAMGPYEVFASSTATTVYTVAAQAGPAPVMGGPPIVAAYTFSDLDAGRGPVPDVVVVPALEHPDSADEAPVRSFVRAAAQRGVRILSVCNGAQVLAGTGILQGLPATAHWSRLGALRAQYPDVRWVDGQRYFDAALPGAGGATITTTAGISSGIPGALHVLADLAGADEAVRVSRLVPYPGWTPTSPTSIRAESFAAEDAPGLLNGAVPWGRPTVGVELADGVSEIDVAAAFEVLTVSNAARAAALADDGWVVTRHGMILAATPARSAPHLNDRVVLPTGADGRASGFEPALNRLESSSGSVIAASAAKMVAYPYSPSGSPWKPAAFRAPAIVGLLVVLAVAGCVAARQGWRRLYRRSPRTTSASAGLRAAERGAALPASRRVDATEDSARGT